VSPPWNARRQHSGGSISVRRTRNMHRIKKNWAGYIAKNARGSHFDERVARRDAAHCASSPKAGWCKQTRAVLYFKHVCTDFDYPRFDRPSVTRGLTNDLSDAIDRVIESFSVFLCARHFSHAIKLPNFGNQHWPFRIVMFIKLISIRLQDNIFIYAKDEYWMLFYDLVTHWIRDVLVYNLIHLYISIF